MKTKYLIWPITMLLAGKTVHAHCPLCTAGIVAIAGGATYFGVSKVVIALLIGAFAVSTGLWAAKNIKKEYFSFQKQFIVLLSFLLTIVPLLPFIYTVYPLPIFLTGEYGSVFNRTYLVNTSLFGSIFGAGIVLIAPSLSNKITEYHGKRIAFQGIIITLMLLIFTSITIQVIM